MTHTQKILIIKLKLGIIRDLLKRQHKIVHRSVLYWKPFAIVVIRFTNKIRLITNISHILRFQYIYYRFCLLYSIIFH